MSVVNGSLIGVYVNDYQIKCEISCDFTSDVEMLPASAIDSGRWGESIAGYRSWSIAVNGYMLLEGQMIVEGKNLINKELIVGEVVNTSGNSFPNNNWISTPMIAVSPSTVYTVSGIEAVPNTFPRICFYDASDVFISEIAAINNTNPVTFTTPGGAAGIRINIANVTGIGVNPTDNIWADVVQLELGNTPTSYAPYQNPLFYTTGEELLNYIISGEQLAIKFRNVIDAIEDKYFIISGNCLAQNFGISANGDDAAGWNINLIGTGPFIVEKSW